MKKNIFASILLQCICLFLFLVSPIAVTYGQQSKKDRIEALKIAFITNRMNLTPSEAQVFWPLYNEYNDKLEALKKERRKKYHAGAPNLDSLSSKELESLVDYEMIFRQKEVDLLKEYHVKFKQVLTPKKLAEYYLAEDAFKRELLKRLKEQNHR